jgi:hypothetical protein
VAPAAYERTYYPNLRQLPVHFPWGRSVLTRALDRRPPNPGRVPLTLRLAEYHRVTGDLPAAVEAARAAADRAKDREDLVDAAGQLALCGTASGGAARPELYDRAAEALLDAAGAGYREAGAVEASETFRPLADHQQFREAVRRMRVKKK